MFGSVISVYKINSGAPGLADNYSSWSCFAVSVTWISSEIVTRRGRWIGLNRRRNRNLGCGQFFSKVPKFSAEVSLSFHLVEWLVPCSFMVPYFALSCLLLHVSSLLRRQTSRRFASYNEICKVSLTSSLYLLVWAASLSVSNSSDREYGSLCAHFQGHAAVIEMIGRDSWDWGQ